MSTYITPVTFEGLHVTPSDDASSWAACISDGIKDGCAMSRSGNTLTLGTGKIIVCGRQCRVDEAKTFPIGNSGYARLLLTIDRSEPTVANQAMLDIQSSATIDGFAALVQDDINSGGTKYQIVLCMMDLSKTGDASILWTCGIAHAKALGVAVDLPVSGWANNLQVAYVSGVTIRSNIVCTPPVGNGKASFNAAEIDAVAYGDGWVQFACTNVPSGTVTAYLLIL